MFSSTAYEALYQYIGLELHSRFIEVLTSHRVFLAIVLMTFGVMFFTTTMQFFSRYLPGSLVRRRPVPLSKFFKIVLCLILGLSILRIGGSEGVKRWDGDSWHTNTYVKAKAHNVEPEYRVSFVFEVVSRSAEEVVRLINRVVDSMFRSTHSELAAPSFFYKAIMFAGASTLEDPELRSEVKRYTENCIPRALPLVGGKESLDRLDGMFRADRIVDEKLATLSIDGEGAETNCLDAKNAVHEGLIAYTRGHSQDFRAMLNGYVGNPLDETAWLNLQASMTLVDHYLEKEEGFAGIQKASQPQGGAARVFQYINRFFSWDGLMSIFGPETHGAVLAAQRSQEFSENLTRAPHVAGFIKLFLIAIFPWLVFPVVAGVWRVIIWWLLAYTSVLMWAPIWTLLYHVMMGISLSADTLAAFGQLSDGVSLYSANLITSRMNYMYAVYSWAQLLVGASFTGTILWFARPILSDSEQEGAPEFTGDIQAAAKSAGRLV